MESKANLLIDSKDPLDDPNFDPVAFINEKFPTEQSLTGLEDFKQSLKKQLDELDQEILQEVRKQACSSEQAKTSLQEANELIRELCKQISEMKDKASTSEQMVQEICRDIRTLDIAKRNLVTAITALKRLYMLENGLEELKNVINSKHYKLATSLVDATSTLLQTFQECQHLEKIKQLKDERNVLCQLLRQKLIQDFQSELTEPKTLQEACVAAEALGYEIQQELVGLECMKQLEPYRLLFNPGQSDSGFEAIDRRFAWLARRLREFRENRANLFPEYWNVTAQITKEFCNITKSHFVQLLESENNEVDLLVNSLQKVIQFENQQQNRYKDQQAVSQKSEQQMNLGQYQFQLEQKPKVLPPPNFKDSISIIFEPYLSSYTQAVEKELLENIEKWILEDGVESQDNPVLKSSLFLFRALRNKLTKCISFAGQKTIFDLHIVFKKTLVRYNESLNSFLKKVMDERSLCYIINTSDYCRKTIDQMQTAVSEQLKETFSSRVDFSEEQSLFDQLASISLKYLLQKVESQFEPSFNMLPKENWADLEGVGDISDYVKDLQKVLESFAKLFINILYEDYYMSFLNKLTIAFSQRFQIAIFKCKKICEYGAQQLLLDCHEIKNTIQQLQQIKKNDGEKLPQSSAYTNHINKSMARVENLLKVISQPPSKVLQVYSTLMDQKDQGEFEKILNLQGVKKSEYPHLFEAFEKQESNKGMTTVKKLFERFT